MGRSFSNLVNDLAEWSNKIKCKYKYDNKKYKTLGIIYKDCEFCLEFTNFKDDLAEYKCLCYNKNYQKKFDENLKKGFVNKYTFSNYDIRKFILLWQKGLYPY